MSKVGKFLLIILAIVAAAVTAWLVLGDSTDQQSQPADNQTDQGSEGQSNEQDNTQDSDENWSTYNNEDLGFSFRYPSEFGEVRVSTEESTDQGRKFTGTFTNMSDLRFGGTTRNFQEGRESLFTDIQGFTKEGDTYYASYPLDRRYELSVEEVVAGEGETQVVIFRGQQREGDTIPPTPFHFGERNFGAVFNLSSVGDDQFGGIGFSNQASDRIPLEQFKDMMRTVIVE